MSTQKEKIRSLVQRLAAAFLSERSARTSLITVTNAAVDDDLKHATIYVTVYPPEREQAALSFARRQLTDLRTYVKEHSQMRNIMRFDIEIDRGEKHRQRIDELSRGEE